MKPILISLICIILIVGIGSYWVMKNEHKYPMTSVNKTVTIAAQTYPFTVTVTYTVPEQVQIYKGTWTQAGGNVIDIHKKLQTDVNGVYTDLPLISQEPTNAKGVATFLLPAGKYFVYISDPAFEDDLPHDIRIPLFKNISISGDRH